MFEGIIGVLALGVIAIMVRDFTQKGSRGPADLVQIGNVTKDFYSSIAG